MRSMLPLCIIVQIYYMLYIVSTIGIKLKRIMFSQLTLHHCFTQLLMKSLILVISIKVRILVSIILFPPHHMSKTPTIDQKKLLLESNRFNLILTVERAAHS